MNFISPRHWILGWLDGQKETYGSGLKAGPAELGVYIKDVEKKLHKYFVPLQLLPLRYQIFIKFSKNYTP